MAQVLTVAAIKGGTGKTTTCAVLAQAAVYQGSRVLCIDLDAQANLTRRIGADQNAAGAYELLHGTPAKELIQTTEQGIDVIGASTDLIDEVTTQGSIIRLQEGIKPILRQYDLIIIDTPPRLCETTYNALQASNKVLIALEADADSLQGMYQIIDLAELIKKSNKKLRIAGCIITRYNKRSKFCQFMREQIAIKGAENGCPLLAEIRQAVAVTEAQALQQSLFDYAPKCNPAADYLALYAQVI